MIMEKHIGCMFLMTNMKFSDRNTFGIFAHQFHEQRIKRKDPVYVLLNNKIVGAISQPLYN